MARGRTGEYSDGLSAQDSPNAVWGADFKGWFKLSTGAKGYPPAPRRITWVVPQRLEFFTGCRA